MNKHSLDYLIVGSGLAGAVAAYYIKQLKPHAKILVIEKREHIGGNVYTKKYTDYHIHYYGPHIFHTNSRRIWDFVNQFTEFERFTYTPVAKFKNEIFFLPINLMTFYQLFGTYNPLEIECIINLQKEEFFAKTKHNCLNTDKECAECFAISQVGTTAYYKLIYHYTKKQWHTEPRNLSSSIVKRLKYRKTFNNDYFDDRYQGLPINGYTWIIESLLTNIPVETETDFFANRSYWESRAKHIIYTGMLDEFFDYQFSKLGWRGIRLEHSVVDISKTIDHYVINHTDNLPNTRTIEHRFFTSYHNDTHLKQTWITKEYPTLDDNAIKAYPLDTEKERHKVNKYKDLCKKVENKVTFVGRLAEYKYYNMDQVIARTMYKCSQFV